MRLSETVRASDWLLQFEDEDRASARALLDSVRFVPGSEVVAGVRGLVEDFISREPDHTPAAVVPVLSIEDMDGVPHDGTVPDPVVFDDFDPAQPIANDPGSEALMAHIVSEIRKGSFAALLVPKPLSLDVMKNKRSRTLLCITDYIGSGQQALNYIETWYRHKTIKSWRSLGWLRIIVLAYASTTAGKNAIEASSHVDELRIIQMAPGIERLRRNPDQRLEEVCRLYAKRGGLGRPLGYRDSAGYTQALTQFRTISRRYSSRVLTDGSLFSTSVRSQRRPQPRLRITVRPPILLSSFSAPGRSSSR